MHHKQRTASPQSTLGGYIWEASVGEELSCRSGKGEVQALVRTFKIMRVSFSLYVVESIIAHYLVRNIKDALLQMRVKLFKCNGHAT